MMVVSLLLWTAPTMAGNTMEWDDESVPDDDDYVILNGTDIVALAVAEGGLAIFAGVGTTSLYVSTDKGKTWDITQVEADASLIDADFVAVTPDDPRYIAVAETSGNVTISDDGGATFDDLGASGLSAVYDLAISRESGDNRWVAVAGINGSDPEVFYYEIGAIGAIWTDLVADSGRGSGFQSGEDSVSAIEFSPNFHSDEILVAVSSNNAAETINFQMYSFNQNEWNADAGFDDYPFDILDGQDDLFATLNKASIALDPDYLGSDGDLRIAFIGTATDTENDTSGIFRLEDDDVEVLRDEKAINSVAFDGVNLIAGRYDDVNVYRSDDPMASSPSTSGSKSYKHPGGQTEVIVGWAGDLAVAATKGDGSGFSVSRNNGKTFNDLSLIDSTLSTMSDVALSADGEMLYLATYDSTSEDLSVWRLADDDWERVFFDDSTNAASDYILRMAPDDPGVVFLADVGGTNIYYSTDSGDSRWYTRSSRYTIADLAVETTGEVLYVLVDASACYVSKSTNTGFTWGGKETTGLSGADGTIVSLGEDKLIVGSASGTVSYSTDGNESWTDLEDSMDTSGIVQVTAQGLADGDFIFAATSNGGEINRWELGEDDSWDDFFDMDSGYGATGIALDSGGKILYVLSANITGGVDSILYRTDNAVKTSPTFKDAAKAGVTFDYTPSALRMTSGSNMLWTIDTTSTDTLYSLEDTVAHLVPIIRTPKTGFTVRVNPVSGNLNNVSLIWESPSDDVTEFDYEVAFDSDFDEVLISGTLTDTWDEGDTQAYEVSGASLMPNTTYYWRVRVDEPFRSGWAESSFKVSEAVGLPPVTVEIPPTPDITVEMPAPEVTVTIPPVVQVPPAPAPITPGFIWGIIIIGALLFVALIVLILRTRRVV